MEIQTVQILLRCPDHVQRQLVAEATFLGFRSVQEYILQIIRERTKPDVVEPTEEALAA